MERGGDKMFYGEYKHSIDSKGRIIIPSKFRDELGKKFFVTKGLDDCLFIFTKKEWDKYEEKLNQIPLTNRQGRAFVRFFYSGAMDAKLDSQGRMNVSSTLIEHAKLEKDLIIAGVGSRIEIWNRDKWEEYGPDNLSMEDIEARMEELGI